MRTKEYIFSDQVMGTELDVIVIAEHKPAREEKLIKSLFKNYESIFSRFSFKSDLTNLNILKKAQVSHEFIDILNLAKELYLFTNGLFNPLNTPYYLGYDRDFHDLKDTEAKNRKFGDNDISYISIDQKNHTVEIGADQYLDFGGFLKGHVAGLAAEYLKKYQGSIVNIGGDIVCHGLDLGEIPFVFEIAHPLINEKTIAKIKINNESLATSSVVKRKWQRAKKTFHHIIDPRSRDSARNNLLSVSVVHHDAAYADALATTGIVMGKEQGMSFFEQKKLKALFITDDLIIDVTNSMKDIISLDI